MATESPIEKAMRLIPVKTNNGCMRNVGGRCSGATNGKPPIFADRQGYCHADTLGAGSCNRFISDDAIRRRPQ